MILHKTLKMAALCHLPKGLHSMNNKTMATIPLLQILTLMLKWQGPKEVKKRKVGEVAQ